MNVVFGPLPEPLGLEGSVAMAIVIVLGQFSLTRFTMASLSSCARATVDDGGFFGAETTCSEYDDGFVSGVQVGDQAALQARYRVFQQQLAFLEPPKLQLVDVWRVGQLRDGGVQIAVFDSQFGKALACFYLIDFVHWIRRRPFGPFRDSMLITRGRGARVTDPAATATMGQYCQHDPC